MDVRNSTLIVVLNLHNDDGICKITSLIICFLVDNSAFENKIPHQITSKWKKCPDVALIDRSNEDCSTAN
jgi:hypothetical protein